MTVVGSEVGRGVRAIVYDYGDDRVIKLPIDATTHDLIAREGAYLKIVERLGARAPVGAELVEHDEGIALISSRVDGPTLWQALQADPNRSHELGSVIAQAQAELFATKATFALPDQEDRLGAKLRSAADRFDLEITALLELLNADTERPRGLCHGDLHPYNIILSSGSPMLVDWFDVSVGISAIEVARTVVLLEDLPAPADELRAS